MSRRWPFALALAAALAAAAVVVSMPPPAGGLGAARAVRAGLHDSYMGEFRDASGGAQVTITLTIMERRAVGASTPETAAFRQAEPELGAGLYFTGEHMLSGDNFPQPMAHSVIGFIEAGTGRALIIPVALEEATGETYPGAFVGTLADDYGSMEFGWFGPTGSTGGSLILEGLE